MTATTIEFLDERYYKTGEDEYAPSVTFILESYPKGPNFAQWLKDVGNNAKMIAERAAESGSKVHNAIESLIAGNELIWDDSRYNETEWLGILRFYDFFTWKRPEVLGCEIQVVSAARTYAGTCDLVCKFDGEAWLLDHKFANAIYPTYYLQLAAYRAALEERGVKIDRMGVLHLKAATRGRGKYIQGNGWKIEEPDKSYEHLLKVFNSVLQIHQEEHPESKPRNRIYPSTIKL